MVYPGEYPEGLLRTTFVQCPVVSGYVTARLQVEGNPIIGLSGFVPNTTLVQVANTGVNTVGLRLQGTNDYTSGPWEWVGGAMSLVPKGQVTASITPRHAYLELVCQSGTSTASMQLSSRLRWTELGFDRTDPAYPSALYTAKSPLTSAV